MKTLLLNLGAGVLTYVGMFIMASVVMIPLLLLFVYW